MSVIELRGVSKRYAHYARPVDRLLEVITGRCRHDERTALKPLDLAVAEAEVIGLIGLNGAGKSTLLKLIAGTLAPSTGEVIVNGRIAALLELGTGFHPEMTGRENVRLSCAVAGISLAQADQLYADIVEFAGLREQALEQPIKTFSSGMVARLAFSVATALAPQVLIVDELLSVGDGAFARKSFDRIMAFKQAGKTLLFASHSMYQVEAMCNRVIWLNEGEIRMEGDAAEVIIAYNAFLASLASRHSEAEPVTPQRAAPANAPHPPVPLARLLDVRVVVDDQSGETVTVVSGLSDVEVSVSFASDPALPCPSVALRISDTNGRTVASLGSANDGVSLIRGADGAGRVEVILPRLPLLKGSYWVSVVLLSEDGIHVYEAARMIAELKVEQRGLEQGIVRLPRRWKGLPAPAPAEVERAAPPATTAPLGP